jgi:hypothetical protein
MLSHGTTSSDCDVESRRAEDPGDLGGIAHRTVPEGATGTRGPACGGRETQLDQCEKEVGLARRMVIQWRQRFAKERLAGLADRPRSGRPRTYTDADRLRVIETACTKTPPVTTHWSVRGLAGGDRGETGRRVCREP